MGHESGVVVVARGLLDGLGDVGGGSSRYGCTDVASGQPLQGRRHGLGGALVVATRPVGGHGVLVGLAVYERILVDLALVCAGTCARLADALALQRLLAFTRGLDLPFGTNDVHDLAANLGDGLDFPQEALLLLFVEDRAQSMFNITNVSPLSPPITIPRVVKQHTAGIGSLRGSSYAANGCNEPGSRSTNGYASR